VDAAFGLGQQTVVDLNVRRSRELSTEKFEITNPDWKKLFSSSKQSKLLEEIRQELSPNNTEIVAELYKLLLYPPGSFFSDHTDTQRGNVFKLILIPMP